MTDSATDPRMREVTRPFFTTFTPRGETLVPNFAAHRKTNGALFEAFIKRFEARAYDKTELWAEG